MKTRKQYVGKPPVHEQLTQYERRIGAMERAGIIPTHTVRYINAPPHKSPIDDVRQPTPATPPPVPLATFRFMAFLVDYDFANDNGIAQEVGEG